MRIFIPQYLKGTEAANILESTPYMRCIYENESYSLIRNVKMLTTAQRILVDEDMTTHSKATKLYYDIAKSCRIEIVGHQEPDIANIIVDICAMRYGIGGMSELAKAGRVRNAVNARFLAALIMDELSIPLQIIGCKLSRDRATAYFYVNRAKDIVSVDKSFKKDYLEIKSGLNLENN